MTSLESSATATYNTPFSGVAGTAATEAEEFFEIYNLKVIVIPTNKKDRILTCALVLPNQ